MSNNYASKEARETFAIIAIKGFKISVTSYGNH